MENQICTRCVMDSEHDPDITFDEAGICSACSSALARMPNVYFPNDAGAAKIQQMVSAIKQHGEGKKYDCIMGISGGLDSSYLAYLGHNWGLRILGVHIDDGFDTPVTTANIAKLAKSTGMELVTLKPDAPQYYALLKAYMAAGVPNLAVPQDNILFATLYKYAKECGINVFLSGVNFALESIPQRGNTWGYMDLTNIKDIHKKYGTLPINRLPFITSYRKYIDQLLKKTITYTPLNYVDYNRDRAFVELKAFCGFEYYGRKHLENVFTAFLQLYWMPKRFCVDKRRIHLSSMIVSGQMTRDEALHELEEPLYDDSLMNEYISIVKDKLQLSDDEFDSMMRAPARQHFEFKTDKMSGVIRKFIPNTKG